MGWKGCCNHLLDWTLLDCGRRWEDWLQCLIFNGGVWDERNIYLGLNVDCST